MALACNLTASSLFSSGFAAILAVTTGVVDEGEQSHYRLRTSVLNLLGVPASGYGDEPTSGPLRGISEPFLRRRWPFSPWAANFSIILRVRRLDHEK
jgi:hypothetical protein